VSVDSEADAPEASGLPASPIDQIDAAGEAGVPEAAAAPGADGSISPTGPPDPHPATATTAARASAAAWSAGGYRSVRMRRSYGSGQVVVESERPGATSRQYGVRNLRLAWAEYESRSARSPRVSP
jgi:hypothetical protein